MAQGICSSRMKTAARSINTHRTDCALSLRGSQASRWIKQAFSPFSPLAVETTKMRTNRDVSATWTSLLPVVGGHGSLVIVRGFKETLSTVAAPLRGARNQAYSKTFGNVAPDFLQ